MGRPERARARMVDALRAAGRVRSAAVEEAMLAVPRHLFLPGHGVAAAYADEAVAVQHVEGVTTSSASQPSMVAIMLDELDLRPGQRVLEIGAGTGYHAALIASILGPAGSVVSVDIDPELVAAAARHLAAAGVTGVRLVCADGGAGHPPGAPYDRIVLTVGSPDVRPEWVAQLAPGGRLLLPLAVRGSQLCVALDLCAGGALRSASVHGCSFIRMRGLAAGPGPLRELDGLAVQVPDDAEVAEPAVVAAALAEPATRLPCPVAVGPTDVWDGCGLWLALHEPGVVRLVARPGVVPPADLLPPGAGSAAVALAPAPDGPLGLAVLVTQAAAGRSPATAGVRAYGPGGPALATRMLAALRAWSEAGSPTASALRLVVFPRDAEAPAGSGPTAAPGTGPTAAPGAGPVVMAGAGPVVAEAGPAVPGAGPATEPAGACPVIDKPHCRIAVSWEPPTPRTTVHDRRER